MVETLPPRSKAGALITLEIAVHHAAGESATLPADLPVILGKGDVRLADVEGFGRSAPPTATPDPNDATHATTLLHVPLLVLSKKTQRTSFVVPQLRVVVLRRGGGDLSVCTSEHTVDVDQPIASTPRPQVRPNPSDVPQITRNERLQLVTAVLAVGLFIGASVMAIYGWWKSRPKAPEPPPPPPDPAEVALAAIASARRDLHDAFRELKVRGELPIAYAAPTKLFFDRVSDALRVHVGRRYGFDGLDCTTDEIVARLAKSRSPTLRRDAIEEFLRGCDLVKFAGAIATEEQAFETARDAEDLVVTTGEPQAPVLPHVDLRPPTSRYPAPSSRPSRPTSDRPTVETASSEASATGPKSETTAAATEDGNTPDATPDEAAPKDETER